MGGGITAEYVYNDNGQRTRKTTFANGLPSETTIYHYNLAGLLISETDENGNLKRDYVWSEASQPLAQIDSNNGGEIIVYLHNDHLLTNRLATDQSQAIAWRWEGEAFGESDAIEDVDGDGNSVEVNLRFPGQYLDGESGLHYNWNRYYDPILGRYITSDPIGLDGGINTFGYVGQNPNRFIDPEGKTSMELFPGSPGANSTGTGNAGSIGDLVGDGICKAFNALWEIRYRQALKKIEDFRNNLGSCVKGCWLLCVEKTRHQGRFCVSSIFSSVGSCPRSTIARSSNNFKSYDCISGQVYGRGKNSCCPPSDTPPQP